MRPSRSALVKPRGRVRESRSARSLGERASAERFAKRSEKQAKEREKERARVVEQLRAAGITDPREGGGDGLLSEPVLVFRGTFDGDLRVFDQDADTVGLARRGRDGIFSAELQDADGACLLSIREDEWWLFFTCTFVLKGRDGNEVARIGHPQMARPRWKLSTVREITSSAGSLGRLKLASERRTVEDPMGNEIAQIHSKSKGEYVVEIVPSVSGPLRAIAVAASIMLNFEIHKSTQ